MQSQEPDWSGDETATEADEAALSAPAAAVYKTHSTSIVDMLEDLKDKVKSELADLRKVETNAQHNYNMLKQSLEDQKAADEKDLADEKSCCHLAKDGLQCPRIKIITLEKKGSYVPVRVAYRSKILASVSPPKAQSITWVIAACARVGRAAVAEEWLERREDVKMPQLKELQANKDGALDKKERLNVFKVELYRRFLDAPCGQIITVAGDIPGDLEGIVDAMDKGNDGRIFRAEFEEPPEKDEGLGGELVEAARGDDKEEEKDGLQCPPKKMGSYAPRKEGLQCPNQRCV